MRVLNWLFPLLILSLGVATGCGGGSSNGGTPTPPPMPGPEPAPPPANGPEPGTLAHLQQNIFGPICAQCHTGGGAPEGLVLSSEQASFDNLVNHPSQQQPSLMRVAPGDPDNSYLVMKVEGAPGITGTQMPQFQTPLSQTQIGHIRDWIANGAPREGLGDNATTLSLAEAQKSTGGALFTLRFSRPLDPDTFSADSVQIYLFDDNQRWLVWPDDYHVTLEDQTLTVSLDSSRVPASGAELVIDDAHLSSVRDLHGRQLEGERDGTGGSNYRFTVLF